MEVANFIDKTLRAAAESIALAAQGPLVVKEKRDQSLVTSADLASEKVIVSAINEEFPEDIVLSEESGLSSAERVEGTHIWVIDPLDGTTNFANGYPFYCVSVARGVFNGAGKIQIVCGGVMDVPGNKVYLAQRGQGARVNGKPLSVREPRAFASNFLVTGFYYTKGTELAADVQRFLKVAQNCQSIRRDGAAALDLALVAAGIYDGYWERGLRPWDVAAGSLLVAEAGGQVANYEGQPGDPFDIEAQTLIAGSFSTCEDLHKLIGNDV